MHLHLCSYRGEGIASAVEPDLPYLPRIGDFLRRKHPGINDEVCSWRVESVTHMMTDTGQEIHVAAWEDYETVYPFLRQVEVEGTQPSGDARLPRLEA